MIYILGISAFLYRTVTDMGEGGGQEKSGYELGSPRNAVKLSDSSQIIVPANTVINVEFLFKTMLLY